MPKQTHRSNAFTIVELLIVIVVIAVLAAISIVAYNGIQERARMSGALSYAGQMNRSNDVSSTVGSWKFDECSGSSVGDSSDARNNGTISGTALWSNDTPTGSGCSFQFNGSTRITTAATITASYYLKAAWVKLSSCVGNNNILSSATGSAHAWYMPSGNGCRLTAGHNNSWSYVSDTANLADSKWHYVVVEFTATSSTVGSMKLWKDGALIATNNNTPVPTNPEASPIQIGGHGGGSQLTGLMDDAVVITKN